MLSIQKLSLSVRAIWLGPVCFTLFHDEEPREKCFALLRQVSAKQIKFFGEQWALTWVINPLRRAKKLLITSQEHSYR